MYERIYISFSVFIYTKHKSGLYVVFIFLILSVCQSTKTTHWICCTNALSYSFLRKFGFLKKISHCGPQSQVNDLCGKTHRYKRQHQLNFIFNFFFLFFFFASYLCMRFIFISVEMKKSHALKINIILTKNKLNAY